AIAVELRQGTMFLVVSLQESLLLFAGETQHRVGHAQRTRDLVPQLIGIAFPGSIRQHLTQEPNSKIAVYKVSVSRFCTPVSCQVGIKLLWSVTGPAIDIAT